MLIKNDWDNVVTKKIEQYNGKTYTYLVIPTNTYVYRGFQYGDSRNEDLFKKGLMTKQDYEEAKIYDKEEYSRKLNFSNDLTEENLKQWDLTESELYSNIKIWMSGHTHYSYDFNYNLKKSYKTRFLSNQMGYKSEIKHTGLNFDGIFNLD